MRLGLQIHGRNHLPGGSDPIPGFGGIVGPGGIAGLIEQVDLSANMSVTSTSNTVPDVVLAGSAFTYDGSTTICFAMSLLVQLDMRASAANQSGGFVIFDLWENGAYFNGLCDIGVSGIQFVTTVERTVYFTPSAGINTYSVRAWRGHGAGVGNPTVDVLQDINAGDPVFASSYVLLQNNPPPTS